MLLLGIQMAVACHSLAQHILYRKSFITLFVKNSVVFRTNEAKGIYREYMYILVSFVITTGKRSY
jgi:hypothetical protein